MCSGAMHGVIYIVCALQLHLWKEMSVLVSAVSDWLLLACVAIAAFTSNKCNAGTTVIKTFYESFIITTTDAARNL